MPPATLAPQRSTRVLVLGNAGMDLSIPVAHLPRPGETVVGGPATRAPGGKGLNQAAVAARAGAAVHFLAAMGQDEAARFVRTSLAAEPFATCQLLTLDQPTDLSFITVEPGGENSIVSLGACADALPPATAAAFAATAAPGDWLVLQGNLSLPATAAAMQQAASAGAHVLFNPAPLRWNATALLPHCHVVVANAGEASALTGASRPAEAARALHAAGVASAVVTCGASGYVWACAAGLQQRPAAPAHATDTTGAGDTFCGTLAAALAAGWELPRALHAASRAAALTVSRPGAYAALPRADELAPLLQSGA